MKITIKRLLVLSFIGFVTTVFIVVALLLLSQRLPMRVTEAKADATYQAGTVASLLGVMLDTAEQSVINVSGISALDDSPRRDELLQATLSNNPILSRLYLINHHRKITAIYDHQVLGDRDLLDFDMSTNKLVNSLFERHQTRWSDNFFSPFNGSSTVALGVRTSYGVIIAEMRFDQLQGIANEWINHIKTPVLVIDAVGDWVSDNMSQSNSQFYNWAKSPIGNDLRSDDTEVYDFLGQRVYASTARVKHLGWRVIVGVPAEMDNPAIRELVTGILFSLVLAVIMAVLLAPWCAVLIQKPLIALVNQTKKIAEGGIPTRQDGPIVEFNSLSNDLCSMAERIIEKEHQAQQSERHIQALLDNSPMVAILRLTRDGVVDYCNPAACESLGKEPNELLHSDLFDILNVDSDDTNFMSLFAKVTREGGAVNDISMVSNSAEGCRHFLGSLFPVPGHHGHIVCMLVDVTRQVSMSEALVSEQSRSNQILEAAPAAMMIATYVGDLGFLITDANHMLCEQFGVPREEFVGSIDRGKGRWLSNLDRTRMVTQLIEDHHVSQFYVWMLNRKQEAFVCELSATLLQVDQEEYCIFVYRDVTAEYEMQYKMAMLNDELELTVQARTEALQDANFELNNTLTELKTTQDELVQSEKLSALGGMVAGISHELNTPLGNGLMAASTLKNMQTEFQRELQEGLRKSVLDRFLKDLEVSADIILRNLERASYLIASFKQVAVDRTSSQRRYFSLVDVIEEVLVTLKPSYKYRSIIFNVDIADDIFLDSYPGEVGQILTNLVQNALVHAFDEEEEGTITVSAVVVDRYHIQLSVQDSGAGMSDEVKVRIYDPFFTTKLGNGGSGLGLHIIHNLVTGLIGGSVEVESEEGKGTCFKLTIPTNAP